MLEKSFHINSLEQLTLVADAIIPFLTKNPIVVFDGEMGTGKTTLISVLCKQMKVLDPISSPTYSIINTYTSSKYGSINHFDFYRIEDEQEAIESGLDEVIDSGDICFIEWAERIPKLLPPTYVRVVIELQEDFSRKFSILLFKGK